MRFCTFVRLCFLSADCRYCQARVKLSRHFALLESFDYLGFNIGETSVNIYFIYSCGKICVIMVFLVFVGFFSAYFGKVVKLILSASWQQWSACKATQRRQLAPNFGTKLFFSTIMNAAAANSEMFSKTKFHPLRPNLNQSDPVKRFDDENANISG